MTEWHSTRPLFTVPLPEDETVIIIDGIHGPALARWSERRHEWQFKHYQVAWWERTSYPMSIMRWRYPKTKLSFGSPDELYEGPHFDTL